MQHSNLAPTESLSDDNGYVVGAILRGAREANNESVETIAKTLRINRRYLEALEDGRFKDLPGNAYAIGFIRSYAEHLNLDSADLIIRYKEASESSSKKTQLDFPEPLPDTGLPGGIILFAGLVVAVLAYGGWYLASENDTTLATPVTPVPEELAKDAGTESSDTDAMSDAVDQNIAAVKSVTESEASDSDVGVLEADSEMVDVVEETTADDATEGTVSSVAEEMTEPVEETTEESVESTAEVVEQIDARTEEAVADEGLETVVALSDSDEAETEADVAGPEAETVDAEVSDLGAAEEISAATTDEEDDSQSLNEEQLRVVQASLEVDSDGEEPSESVQQQVVDDSIGDGADVVDEQSDDAPVLELPTETELAATNSEDGSDGDRPPRVYGEDGDVRIVITAITTSWAEVRDTTTDELLLTRLLRAGDSFRVPDRSGIVLVTGNAGGLEISVDGQIVPPVGGFGDVRRDVTLDPKRLIAGNATN